MLHYLLYKTLADERTRDLVAVARRRQMVAEAIHDSRDARSPAARLRDVAARMVALLKVRLARRRLPARGGVTLPSASDACPIGCAT